MMMPHSNEQRTAEWFAERLGKVTASRISDVMAKTKSSYSASRNNYLAELVCERLTGCASNDTFVSKAMLRGTELEPIARDLYNLIQADCSVQEVGFIPHPTIEYFGASPDGFVNDDGLIEIKCPNTWTHLEFIKTRKPKREYLLQMTTQMMCTGRKWCDFVSFDNRLPESLQLKIVRFHFDPTLANEIEKEVISFLNEVEDEIQKIMLNAA